MAKTEILGIGDMQQRYGRVRDAIRTRTSRRMLVAAGNVLKRKAKAIALANGSRRTGAMVKNIAIKRETAAPPGTEQYHLGVRHGRNLSAKARSKGERLAVNGRGRIVKRYADDPYYWRWVELGHNVVPRKAANGSTSLRQRRKSPTHTVPAKPFIAPALEQGRAEALQAMNERLQQDLDKDAGG
ncbi:HK97-gp10 family putative phage morphogenesis protein [Melaminivora sp.]|uniref:HK97-gp10 family putative phage morphogenesis protein n=1 Tax=Melaminivora sp. TaxID=1933032 RepID=UPI0028AB5FAF|nr:HK97-gp10 family putative phage morphogenesis protein [Melaminivora sp.]